MTCPWHFAQPLGAYENATRTISPIYESMNPLAIGFLCIKRHVPHTVQPEHHGADWLKPSGSADKGWYKNL